MPASSVPPDVWRLRARTAEALLAVTVARIAVALAPLPRWRGHLGLTGTAETDNMQTARRMARHIERAADRLPIEIKCLPRAVGLSLMLRRRAIPHRLTIAARPAEARRGSDDLHAWIEAGGEIVLGELPGPWLPILVLP